MAGESLRRLRDWWLTRRWPWWPDAMKVARDLDAEARATFSDDQALGLGRVVPAPGESPATTEQVPVLLFEPRMAMLMANPKTGEATEGHIEAIVRAGLHRLTWPAALVKPAVGRTLQRTPTESSCATPTAARGSAARSCSNRAGSAEQ
jgi:hypothetical protein